MEWNGKWNEMERKFRYGIWKMPEWNGMEDFKNEMEDNLPYQFHTRFRALYLQKNTYRCRVVIYNIVTEVFNFNIYAYLFVDKSRYFGCVHCTEYVLHHCRGGFRGGDGGMHPPHQPKSYDFGRKISPYFE